MSRLKKYYIESINPELKQKFGYKNSMEVPRVEKIVINCGFGEAVQDQKLLESVINDIALITGQRPVPTLAKKAISNFKIREGMKVGCKVTLRRKKMYEFMDRLFNVCLPRIRDFRGLPGKFDRQGNYAIGIVDHSIFPEIPPPDTQKIFGMQVQFCMRAQNETQSRALLKQIGVPFRPS